MPVSAIRKKTYASKGSPKTVRWNVDKFETPRSTSTQGRSFPAAPRRKRDVGDETDAGFEDRVENARAGKLKPWNNICSKKACALGIHTLEDFEAYQEYAEQRMEHYADLADDALRNGRTDKYMELMKFVRQVFHEDIIQLDHCYANDLLCKDTRRTPVATKTVSRIPSSRSISTGAMIRDYETRLERK